MIYGIKTEACEIAIEKKKLIISDDVTREYNISDLKSSSLILKTKRSSRSVKKIFTVIFIVTAITTLISFLGQDYSGFKMLASSLFSFSIIDKVFLIGYIMPGLLLGTIIYFLLFFSKNRINRVVKFCVNITLKRQTLEETINFNEDKLDNGSEKFSILKRDADILVAFINKWLREAEELEKKVPSFDIEKEMKNPIFFNYISFYANSLDNNIIANAYLYVLKNQKSTPETVEEIVNISPKNDMNCKTQYCRKCGVEIPNDGEYCHKCGTKIVCEED